MKRQIYRSILIVFIFASIVSAGPADSLMNVKTWKVSDGGNGHTYALVAYRTTWDSSFYYASQIELKELAGYLATVTTQEENDFILNNIIIEQTAQNAALEQFYLGGIYDNSSWEWITGEPFTFINWASGEPNNVGVETVMAMWGFKPSEIDFPSGEWNNTLPDTSFNPYAYQWSIIEWDTPIEPHSLLIPTTISAVMMRPYGPFFAQIYIGDFEELHTADDIDLPTLRINGTHIPDNIETASHSSFLGDALKLELAIQDFVSDYYPFWGNSTKEYTVSGMYNDGTPFEIIAAFNAIGHTEGDVNLDGSVNLIDLNEMVKWKLRGSKPPRFPEIADVNGSCGEVNILDLAYMVEHLLRGGPAPLHCNE